MADDGMTGGADTKGGAPPAPPATPKTKPAPATTRRKPAKRTSPAKKAGAPPPEPPEGEMKPKGRVEGEYRVLSKNNPLATRVRQAKDRAEDEARPLASRRSVDPKVKRMLVNAAHRPAGDQLSVNNLVNNDCLHPDFHERHYIPVPRDSGRTGVPANYLIRKYRGLGYEEDEQHPKTDDLNIMMWIPMKEYTKRHKTNLQLINENIGKAGMDDSFDMLDRNEMKIHEKGVDQDDLKEMLPTTDAEAARLAHIPEELDDDDDDSSDGADDDDDEDGFTG